jgi:hypothetical protein
MGNVTEISLNYEKIGGLVWYAECMDRALLEIRSFSPPANDVRFYHSLFVVNLMSLVDRSGELFGIDVSQQWSACLNGHGGLNGENNIGYVRELRNAVVHRGLDIAASGVVISDHVRAVAPSVIADRSGRRGPFKAFGATLFEIFEVCRSTVGPVILTAAEPLLKEIEQVSLNDLRANYLDEMEATGLVPEWVKKMAREGVTRIPFDDVRSFHSNKLRSLLA